MSHGIWVFRLKPIPEATPAILIAIRYQSSRFGSNIAKIIQQVLFPFFGISLHCQEEILLRVGTTRNLGENLETRNLRENLGKKGVRCSSKFQTDQKIKPIPISER